MSNSNKRLTYALRILELVIQTLAFLGLTYAVCAGALDRPDDQLWRCLIIAVPVIAAYIMRRYIKKFSWFMAGNVVLLAIAVLAGQGEDEKFFFFVIILLIVAYSIRLKRKSQYQVDMSSMAINLKEESADIGIDNVRDKLLASERVPMPMAAIMVIGYMAGYAMSRSYIMNAEVVICILFVMLQVVYNNLERLNTIIIRNSDKSEFPAEQIARVNKFTMIAAAVFILIGMLLFYNGEYGNIFQVIRSGAGMAGTLVVRAFIFMLGLFGGNEQEPMPIEETTEAAADGALGDLETIPASPIAEAAAEAVGTVLILALLAAVMYIVFMYIKSFNRERKPGLDVVEYIKPDRKKVKTTHVDKIKVRSNTDSGSMAVRKLYKKSVMKGMGMNKPDSTLTPDELTRTAITAEASKADIITGVYEKARYSDEQLTGEEIKEVKNHLTGSR